MRRRQLLILIFTVVVLLIGGAVWLLRPAPSTTDAAVAEVRAQPADVAAPSPAGTRGSAAETVTAPREPGMALPAPETISGTPDEQAAILARRVLAGGPEAVSAVVTIVHLAGFPIRQDGGAVTPPPGASQGIVFDAWEVNALADLFASRRAITAPLSSLAEAYSTAVRDITPGELATHLLAGVRSASRSTTSPGVFWSAVIVELGRNARAHAPYDLLGEVDADATHLDLLQIALLSKRLAGDVLGVAYPERRSGASVSSVFNFLSPVVHAQSPPCGFTGAEAEIMDWTALISTTAFGGLTGLLGNRGVAGAETAGSVAAIGGVILSYLKLAMTQAVFEIRFELEQSPLVRTTKVRPQSGEQRTLISTVSLDYGKLQWINCFRIMLNAVGLDLNTESSGPVEGAEVTWYGWAGFRGPWAVGGGTEQLARFTSGGAAGSVTTQKTDAQGKARILVEGIGQEEFLGSQPREVMKDATVSAMVVLKPASLYRDLKDAGATASGGLAGVLTMPAELLYRTRWSFGGNYTFPVKDWKTGNGWTGTIAYRRIERRFLNRRTESICCGGRPTIHESTTESEEIVEGSWEIPAHGGSVPLSADFSMATARYRAAASRKKNERSFNTGWASCRGGSHPQTSRTHRRQETGTANYSGTAEVTVELADDGSFSIAAGAGNREMEGELRGETRSDRNNGCDGVEPTRTASHAGRYRAGDHTAGISGKADPDTDTLKGSLTRVQKSAQSGITTTHIYEWNLKR